MSYRLLDLDLDQPIPSVTLGAEETGLAVIARRNDCPVAFWIAPHPAGSRVAPETISAGLASEAGHNLLRMAAEEEVPRAGEMRSVSVTLAVCTHNRPERLERCLESIRALYVPSGAQRPTVLVVDNSPPDARAQAVAEAAGVRYVREPLVGLNFARNRALAESDAAWLAFLDDDVVVDPGWLSGFYDALATHPDAGAVTGLVLPFALETDAQILFERAGGFRRGCRPIRYHGSELDGSPLYPVGAGIFGAGANMAFRREDLLALGGFDEALDTGAPLPGGGDLDAFYRIVRAGRPLIYWPRQLVFHEHRRDMLGLRRQYGSWGTGFMAFLTKAYRTDRQERSKQRRMVAWWFSYQLRRLAQSAVKRHELPPRMILTELVGGVQGLAGEYGRSRRRVAQIREAAEGTAWRGDTPNATRLETSY